MAPRPENEPLSRPQSEIAGVIAALASRQGDHSTRRKLTGPERAAVLMLALGQQYGANIWSQLDDDELREISIVMSTLGTIEAESVEGLLLEFVSRMSASGALMGNYDATETLLKQYLPPERVTGIMEEIRGPAGRNMWEKLSNVQEGVLANYLKNEYPQTIAVVLSKLRPECMSNLSQTRQRDAHEVMAEIFNNFDRQTETRFMTSLEDENRESA